MRILCIFMRFGVTLVQSRSTWVRFCRYYAPFTGDYERGPLPPIAMLNISKHLSFSDLRLDNYEVKAARTTGSYRLALLSFIDGKNSGFLLRRDTSNSSTSAEPNISDFEILSGLLVNHRAAFCWRKRAIPPKIGFLSGLSPRLLTCQTGLAAAF